MCDAKIPRKKNYEIEIFHLCIFKLVTGEAKDQHIVIVLQYSCSTCHVLELNDQVQSLHHKKCM